MALFAASAQPGAEPPGVPFVQAAVFDYHLCPPDLWERELVRLKNIGIDTVDFSVAATDFNPGAVSNPRTDLPALIRLLRRLNLQAFVETGGLDSGGRRRLAEILATQTVSHGGPVAWVSVALPGVEAPAPRPPFKRVDAVSPDALAESRQAILGGRGTLIWNNVFDALYPAGAAEPFRAGAIALNGVERSTAALRREAMLLRNWAPLLPSMQPAAPPKAGNGKFPEAVSAAMLASPNASAVSIVNRGAAPFEDDLRVTDPIGKRSIVIPNVYVAAGDAMWLPLGVSLSQKSLCRECSNFSPVEQIIYATAELVSIEFENGILAMEFAAPKTGSVVLQLEREPVGPLLAAGKPTDFEWDQRSLRARLPIPAGTTPDRHVRIGIAIEEPETSAFFDDAHRLIIGAKNALGTTYSSPDVAARSRLRLPEGYTAEKKPLTPNQIEYDVAVPASAVEGDYANLALEADGMSLGRARLQLFKPLGVQFSGGVEMHLGQSVAVSAGPPLIPIEPKGGTEVEVRLRNNWPAIQTYKIEASGEGLDVLPAKTEMTIGAAAERILNLRIFGGDAGGGALRTLRLHVTGPAALDVDAQAVVVPRTASVLWSADLDEDGSPEYVLESAQVRAVFSSRDGRWVEFTWKDGGLNFLPAEGVFRGTGPVQVRASDRAIEFAGIDWTRTIRLDGASMTVIQTPTVPPDGLAPAKRDNIGLKIDRQNKTQVVYTLAR